MKAMKSVTIWFYPKSNPNNGTCVYEPGERAEVLSCGTGSLQACLFLRQMKSMYIPDEFVVHARELWSQVQTLFFFQARIAYYTSTQTMRPGFSETSDATKS